MPDYAQAMRLVGHSHQGGRPDAMQLMVYGRHAYVGHLFSGGFSMLDVADPHNVRPVHFEAAPPNTWNIHLQTADDLPLVVHAKDLWAEFRDESAYYGGSVGTKLAGTERTWNIELEAGLAQIHGDLGTHPAQDQRRERCSAHCLRGGVAGSCPRAAHSRRATPLATAAWATASATDSATRRLNTLGTM